MTGTIPRRFGAKAVIFYIVLFAAWPVATPAQDQSELRSLPPILSTISDEVGVLTVSQGQILAKTLADIERQTGVKIVVVILTTSLPESIEAYVQRLINRWRRESKRLDDGRFVFVAIAKEDRELRIVPSKKLTLVLKPFIDSGIMVDARALLKQDKYFEALVVIVDKLSQLIGDAHSVVLNRESETMALSRARGCS